MEQPALLTRGGLLPPVFSLRSVPLLIFMYSTQLSENTRLRGGGMFIREGQGYLMLRAPFFPLEFLNLEDSVQLQAKNFSTQHPCCLTASVGYSVVKLKQKLCLREKVLN